MPYRCRDCRKHFSVRTGTVMQQSGLPVRKWVIAIYLCSTNLKGVSSMKLHRDRKITQKTAWLLAHRIRETMSLPPDMFNGHVEVDETNMGGKRKNMGNAKRKEMAVTERDAFSKTAVIGAKDREIRRVAAKVVEETNKPTLHRLVKEPGSPDTR